MGARVDRTSLCTVPAVLVVSAFLHSFSTRGRITTNVGWREDLLVLSMEYPILAVSHLTASGLVCFDGRYSHISLQLIQEAQANYVKLYCLPQNCTHVVQPL